MSNIGIKFEIFDKLENTYVKQWLCEFVLLDTPGFDTQPSSPKLNNYWNGKILNKWHNFCHMQYFNKFSTWWHLAVFQTVQTHGQTFLYADQYNSDHN